jgi:general secretion pathway protein D
MADGMTGAADVASRRAGVAVFAGEVTIVPDAGTNSLLIRASGGDFALIQQAVRQLDIRPLQVLIEVLIVEARKDRGLSFGVDASFAPQQIAGLGKPKISSSTEGIGLSEFVLRVMGAGSLDIDATLRAAASNGSARIVSRPIVLAANNEQASILVGTQRPFVQVQRSLPTDASVRDRVVQYKDVGTQLVVRPTVSADGYVTLEVTQEVNSATAETAFDAPVISTRSVQTTLLVRDSQTIVLGGLTDEQREANQGGVPLLSRIPWLGGLFGRRTSRASETELLLFLTPRVIRSDDDAERLTSPLRSRVKGGPHER